MIITWMPSHVMTIELNEQQHPHHPKHNIVIVPDPAKTHSLRRHYQSHHHPSLGDSSDQSESNSYHLCEHDCDLLSSSLSSSILSSSSSSLLSSSCDLSNSISSSFYKKSNRSHDRWASCLDRTNHSRRMPTTIKRLLDTDSPSSSDTTTRRATTNPRCSNYNQLPPLLRPTKLSSSSSSLDRMMLSNYDTASTATIMSSMMKSSIPRLPIRSRDQEEEEMKYTL